MLFEELIASELIMHWGSLWIHITTSLSLCILRQQHIDKKRVLESTRKDEIVNGRKETDLKESSMSPLLIVISPKTVLKNLNNEQRET